MRMMVAVALLTFLLAAVPLSNAQEPSIYRWPHWRGPTANGQAEPSAKPPIRWDSKTHVQWTAKLPGTGTSTPIVWDDQVFVVSAEETSRASEKPASVDARARTKPPEKYYRFVVTSLDRTSGKVRWQKVATEQVPHEGHHETHTYAAGSPTTDGERLYVSFASRGLFCYSMQGDLIWSADLGDMRTRLGWGEAVTPALSRDALIVNWDQEEDSFITALDKKTGQPIWKTARAGEPTTWNTPLVTEVDGKTLIVVNGPERVRAYDASSGKEVWQCGGQTVNPIPSPVRFEDTVICISGYRGAAGMAIPLSSQGDVTDSPKIRWKISEGTPYVPSPALSSGRLIFTGGNNGLLTCVDAKTGKVLISKRRLSGIANIYASPTVANGHVYLASREGTTIVLKDNENLDLVAVNQLEGSLDASPVAVGNQLLLRSWDTVYCLADPAS